MKKVTATLILIFVFFSNFNVAAESLYDFDHKVYYDQIKLSDTKYQLEIRSDSYQHFTQQSVFLLRHSSLLCKGSTYTLKVLAGVQSFDAIPTVPRGYQPNLKVLLTCNSISD
ncbi:hypothetical protein [Pseudoalteromonas denitrificans]|uniref:Uncharacterized protein n=1 Tax=Pseudoalteromonas denitrificans DSM 6059 TaxID=1123010 RepID=A0A1I1MFU0_9GAMM|nr:hypothetical protein [Pseudoalteromonas denitrificans]SFC81513.1 hypothetical protein SAMN02745724_02604 [Pseudoalteromonas denitrificans DSM 6059]